MSRKPTALIDMDGTVADFHGAIERDLRLTLAPGEILPVDHHDENKYPYIRARRLFIKSFPDWWLSLPRIESGFKVVDMMRQLKFKLNILTRGPKAVSGAWEQKFKWVRREIPDALITITNAEKSMNYGRVLFDDWVDYVKPWLARRPRGTVILPDRPWNQGFTHSQVVRYIPGINDDEVFTALKSQRER